MLLHGKTTASSCHLRPLPLICTREGGSGHRRPFRSEELEKSQIMHTLHMLTDRYGPRVTGTPNHEAAAKWVSRRPTVGHQERAPGAVGFRASGMDQRGATGFIVAPVQAESEIRSAGVDAFDQGDGDRVGHPDGAAAGAAGPAAKGALPRQAAAVAVAEARGAPARSGSDEGGDGAMGGGQPG